MCCREIFETRLSKAHLQRRVKDNWACWRLIYSEGGFDYNTVMYEMTPQEILEANIALDIVVKTQKSAQKRGKRG